MVGGKTVGTPDPLGMNQAQSPDGAARRAMASAKSAFGRVSDWREERRIKGEVRAESRRREAQHRLDEEEARRANVDTSANVDAASTEGGALTEFNKVFLDTLRRGQSRTEQGGSSDAMIRDVITSQPFINAISAGTIRTPLEDMDAEYRTDMGGTRAELARKLVRAREDRAYMLGDLTTHEVDIIYSTILGSEDKNLVGTSPGAAAIWTNTTMPEGLPKPPDAFFIFLESVAAREKPDDKGRFIGSVLKGLTVRRTFVDTQDTTFRNLVDGEIINEYLHRSSAYAIDTAVESFHTAAVELLDTPTAQKTRILGMPGTGYAEGFERERTQMRAWQEEARVQAATSQTNLESANRAHATAQGNVQKAQGDLGRVNELKKKADREGSVRLAGGGVWRKDGPEIPAHIQAAKTQLQTAEGELRTADGWVKTARSAKARADTELRRRTDEVVKFEATANPTEFARELARHFKSLLEDNRGAHTGFDQVASSMEPRLPCLPITNLITRARELLDLMEETREHFNPDQMAEEQLLESMDEGKRAQLLALADSEVPEAGQLLMRHLTGRRREDTATFGHLRGRFEGEMGKLAAEIDAAEIPDDVKERLRSTHRCMAGLRHTKDEISKQLDGIGADYAYPLGKAVKHAIRSLGEKSYRNLAGLREDERIVARMEYEKRSGDLRGLPGSREGWWTKKWQWAMYHLFTGKSWMGRDRQNPGKLVWLYRKTLADPLSDLNPRNWFDVRHGKEPSGKPYRRKVPRVVDGAWGLTWRLYIVGAALGGAAITTGPLESGWSYVWPWNWPRAAARPITMLAETINGGPIYLPDSQDHIYLPWSWFMPKEGDRHTRRVIADSFDIPERLAARGDDYYRNYWGVGTRKVGQEADDGGMNARLAWLAKHPDVMRFFQERTTLEMEVRVKEISRAAHPRPEHCSNSKVAVPDSCKKLGLSTPQLISEYQPVANPKDGWKADGTNPDGSPMQVCCTIEISSRKVQDGLKLNPTEADRFVDLLMAAERGGQAIDYAFLANSRKRWQDEWFLATPNEAAMTSKFRIYERDNVGFMVMQGAGAGAYLLSRCAPTKDAAPEFLREEHRDGFIGAWRAEIAAALKALPAPQPVAPAPEATDSAAPGSAAPAPRQVTDPLTQRVPIEVLDAAFRKVHNQHPEWFEDTSVSYQRAQVRLQLPDFEIQNELVVDALTTQGDLLAFVKQFGTRSSHRIAPERFEDFVQKLDMHRREGGKLEDYSPFSTAPGAGGMVEWAVNSGFITPNETFSGAGSQAAGAGSAAPAASGSAQRPAGPAPLPELAVDGQRFYANPANGGFTNFFDAVRMGMFTDTGSDGNIARAVLASKFGNDRGRMESAIKEDMFRFLQSTSPADAVARGGLTVSGAGAEMTVSPADMAKARASLRSHMRQAVSAWGR
jgi:hypothetical protein